MAAPGNTDSHQALNRKRWPLLSMRPQLTISTLLRPKKLSAASSRMAWPTIRVPTASAGARALGTTSRREDGRFPHAQAAHRVDELQLLDAHHLAAHEARHLRPGQERDHGHHLQQAGAGQGDDHGRQDEARHDLEDLGYAHEQQIDHAAVEAGDRADQDADHGGAKRGGKADAERDLDAMRDADEDVAPQLVGARADGRWTAPASPRT